LQGSFTAINGESECVPCAGGEFQRLRGQTACVDCTPGYTCNQGAAEPVPCPAGHTGNATGMFSSAQCTPVPRGFWAPLGSAVPEICPASGFYCPGALADSVHFGAKPIIMPVGQSTRTEEVPTLTKEMTLGMSIDELNIHRETLVAQLASQFGVHPSLITLEQVRAGSVHLIVTIATARPTLDVPAVDIDTLMSTVSAVDDATLSASLAAALGSANLTVVSSPAQQETRSRIVQFSCPRGKWWSVQKGATTHVVRPLLTPCVALP
jgi:uncharacterized protein (DUF1501 family)